jgi:hypothetical protein
VTASVAAGEIPGLAIINAEAERIYNRIIGVLYPESPVPVSATAEMLTLHILHFQGYPIHDETRARLHDLAGQSADGLATRGV